MADYTKFFGWHDNPEQVQEVVSSARIPYLSGANGQIKGSGEGKNVVLTQIYEKVTGKVFPVLTQAIGDCTSFAMANALHCLMAAQILIEGKFGSIPHLVATEYIYGVGRVFIANNAFRGNDGSTGAATVQGAAKYGILLREKYGNVDLSTYDGNRARSYGDNGPPKELIPIAKQHLCKTYSLVDSYEQARDAIANGYPLVCCSSQGFTDYRDSEGFSKPSGKWEHALAAVGVLEGQKRKGILIDNSWGNWNTGPLTNGQPQGSFFVDKSVFEDRMLSSRDSWVISNLDSYEAQDLDWNIAELAKKRAENYV